ncbi:MAG: acyltransferase family protein [Bdellovibrionales bacterium]|nr:acyltransferase family protein [Bdellovibrionales bacterium]
MKKKLIWKKQSLPLQFLKYFKKNAIEKTLFGAAPKLFLEFMAQYFRLEIYGTENIPLRGPIVFTPNHSGFAGLDAMILSHQILKFSGRQPRVLTHRLWFATQTTAFPAKKLGFIKATKENGIKILSKNQSLIVFPEGEEGNFKSTLKAYDLQEFKRGFVRMALAVGAPIVPTIIIGAEETHINLHQIKLPDLFKGLILPLPLNFIPLPAKWKIIFLPAIHLPYGKDQESNNDLIREIAEDLREKMQEQLNLILAERKSVYF